VNAGFPQWLRRGLRMLRHPVKRDPEVLQQKRDAAKALRQHGRLLKEIAAIQRELERYGGTAKGN